MITGSKTLRLVMVGLVCLASLSYADSAKRQKKAPKKPAEPPIPSGPQGPLQHQVPLESIPAVPPHVTYTDGQLTIVAPNSTLGDILRAVHKLTSADMEIPATATERVVAHLGPGTAQSVMAELLNGSKFNYVLLGSPTDQNVLTRVVLVAKSGGESAPGAGAAPSPEANAQLPHQFRAAMNQNPNGDAPAVQAMPENEEAAAEDAPDTGADSGTPDEDQQAESEANQPQVIQDQNAQQGVKTPQQMLQEMQQRQLQMQQQVAPGQPPIPGGGLPHPPDQQQTQPDQQ